MDNFANFAKTRLSVGIGVSDTAVMLVTGGGALLPAPPFNATIWNATDFGDPADDPAHEIVRVTAVNVDALTVTRAQESTAALAHNTASKVYKIIATLTAKTFGTDIPAYVQAQGYVTATTAPVTSVASKTGAVTLVPTDVGAASAVHTHAEADVTNLTTDLAARARTLTTSVVITGNGADQTEDTLWTYSLPGGTLANNGSYLHIGVMLTMGANTDTKVTRVYFGGTIIASRSAADNGLTYLADFYVQRVTATTQITRGLWLQAGASIIPVFITTPSETLANPITIKITGQDSTTPTQNSLVVKSVTVELWP